MLLGFLVGFVTSAGAAEFFKFYFARGGFLVFGSAIVLAFALGALEMDYVAHGAAPLSIVLIR
jgi:hypothetical protein